MALPQFNRLPVSMAGAAGGHFELNVAKPVIIYNVLQSIELLAQGMTSLTSGLVEGLKADEKTLKRNVESSLLQATAYSRAHMIVARIVAGIGLGTVNSTAPVLQSEYSPKASRGLCKSFPFAFNSRG